MRDREFVDFKERHPANTIVTKDSTKGGEQHELFQ